MVRSLITVEISDPQLPPGVKYQASVSSDKVLATTIELMNLSVNFENVLKHQELVTQDSMMANPDVRDE